jgi:tRNA(fMet)-specific endonuclease VapC
MLVLDTDHLTIVQRKEGEAYASLDVRLEAAASAHAICVTLVSFEEQMRGWLAYIARSRSMERQVEAYRRLHALLDDFHSRQILDFDEIAAKLYQHLLKSRIRIGTMDLKIAAIALSHGAILLSRNLADFAKVPGLQVEDWTTIQI